MNKTFLKKSSESGFSLIELSVAIIIISIGLITALQISKIEFYEESQEELLYSLNNANDLLLSYYIGTDQTGTQIRRFPCPARPDLPMTHVDFGKEDCSGVSIVNSTVPDPDSPGNNLEVLIGALPIQNLNARPEDAFDVYGGQYVYAVSAKQTIRVNFLRTDLNAVQRQDETSSNVGNPLPFLIASLGETGRGAYDIDGNLIEACPVSTREGENCDRNDAVFLDAFIAERVVDTAAGTDQSFSAFYDGRLGFDEVFFGRVSNAVLLMDINCPDGEFLSGFVNGDPVCSPVAEIADSLPTVGGGGGGGVTSTGRRCQGADNISIGGFCVQLAVGGSK